MRAAVLVLVVLAVPLAACVREQEKQLAACKLEAMRLYEEPKIADAFHMLPYNKFIVTCMAANGYGMIVRGDRCVTGVNFAIQVDCYKPAGRIERILFDLEEKFR